MGKAAKEDVIEILEEIATLLELRDENVFKIRAFQNAVRVLEGDPRDLQTLLETGELEKIKGIGKGSIAKIIREFFKTGKSKDHQELRKGFPDSLFELFQIPGLGAKRIKQLYKKLGVRSVGELEYACKENRLLDLEGFGEKSQEKVLQGISHLKKSAGHYLISAARQNADLLLDYLKKQKGVQKIQLAGSIRRHKEIIRDIDVLVSAKDPAKIHQAFVRYPQGGRVIAHGETKSSIVLKSGMNCDLRTVTEKEFPYALYYFTGSKEHNVAVRTMAKKKGLKINEYGLFKGKKWIPCENEEEIFKKVGLHYIPPEARENHGEIEWAQKQPFPALIEEADIRGIFHVHSNYSDGNAPLEAMIEACEKLGYEYVGISDHSQTARYAKGLEPERLRIQWKEIDRLQKKFKIRIFKGIESDILPNGKLDYADSVLKQFDFVIGSVHSHFTMTEMEMKNRMHRALENKYLTFLGHPTGRLLLGREGYAVNMEQIIRDAKTNGVVVELNANPYRLDVDWRAGLLMKKMKVKTSINPDAHSVDGLKDVSYGVGIARKAWFEKKDVFNTMKAGEIDRFFRARR